MDNFSELYFSGTFLAFLLGISILVIFYSFQFIIEPLFIRQRWNLNTKLVKFNLYLGIEDLTPSELQSTLKDERIATLILCSILILLVSFFSWIGFLAYLYLLFRVIRYLYNLYDVTFTRPEVKRLMLLNSNAAQAEIESLIHEWCEVITDNSLAADIQKTELENGFPSKAIVLVDYMKKLGQAAFGNNRIWTARYSNQYFYRLEAEFNELISDPSMSVQKAEFAKLITYYKTIKSDEEPMMGFLNIFAHLVRFIFGLAIVLLSLFKRR